MWLLYTESIGLEESLRSRYKVRDYSKSSRFFTWQSGRDDEIARERSNKFLCNLPSPWAWMVQLTPHHHPDSRLLTGIPDPGARTNPDSRDTSTITMLEMALFPMYLREKIKQSSPSSSFPPSPCPVCRPKARKPSQDCGQSSCCSLSQGRQLLHCCGHPKSEVTTLTFTSKNQRPWKHFPFPRHLYLSFPPIPSGIWPFC